VATASADKKGMKRICPTCSTRYYDFGKRPVICPNCKTEFTGEIKTRARRARAASNDIIEDGQVSEETAAEKIVDADEDDALLEGDEGVVSLEDLDEDDDEKTEDDDEDMESDPDLELDEDEDDFDEDDEDEDDEDLDDEDEDGDGKPVRKKK
jgi:uncharacterized protein (TIGR02300 family)